MAKSYLQGMMGQNERVVLETRQHWFILLSNILLEIILILLLAAGFTALAVYFPAGAYGLLLVLIPLIGMVRDILNWYNRAYIVTNRRVIQISGVFEKNVIDSSLEKVNDVKMSQSFWGRLFDYGDIEILTASEIGVNMFKRISDPVKFKTAMLNAKEKLGFDDVGGRGEPAEDIPALIAKLDELRKQGIITDDEFKQKKAEMLAKM
jgi:hypothetical protein